MHLLVTRPEPEASALADRLRSAGHTVTIEPLLTIEPAAEMAIDLSGVQALIVTSRNALRVLAARPELGAALALPLVAVGPGTAAAARALGFTRVIQGPAAARDLPTTVHRHLQSNAGPLLHLAGEDLAFDLAGALGKGGYATRVVTLYRSMPAATLTATTINKLQSGEIGAVLLMSPRTAAIWAALIESADLVQAVRNIVHICLSGAVADRLAKLALPRVELSIQPNLEEMLALVARVAAQSRSHS